MSIEVESFGLTGAYGITGINDLLLLKHPPTTGLNGAYDIAVDPNDGPAQRLGIDFGVTHLDANGATCALSLNLEGSDIKDVMEDQTHGVTGMLYLRVIYNY